ncbi:MAG TPA: 30S ribosomal protein S18 [Caldisericia bacterium]|nr:30S ribosomal protein S18 [Caldisericia bacterium]HPF48984.1 30S ribosomal protein S18 [Caldisericia bacterium]HPI83152.1 30S ribosomal protein S18 [Caldisericia bacterium]HPQ92379.1 30S ribosomal protein S18 [Caldisericia bacterium]HRV74523.1 30S ribosomal protein S18 [Caldisericia bacterium]
MPAPNGGRPRRPKRRFGKSRRRICIFCAEHIDYIDYKDINRLNRHVTETGKIVPRRQTGVCAKHQRRLTLAIKRAREIALLPFVVD